MSRDAIRARIKDGAFGELLMIKIAIDLHSAGGVAFESIKGKWGIEKNNMCTRFLLCIHIKI